MYVPADAVASTSSVPRDEKKEERERSLACVRTYVVQPGAEKKKRERFLFFLVRASSRDGHQVDWRAMATCRPLFFFPSDGERAAGRGSNYYCTTDRSLPPCPVRRGGLALSSDRTDYRQQGSSEATTDIYNMDDEGDPRQCPRL